MVFLTFNSFLMNMVRVCWKNSKLTLTVFFLCTLFLLHQTTHLKIIFSTEDLAGQGFPAADELQSLKDRFQDGVNSLFILVPPAGKKNFSIEELCQIRRWYSFERMSIPELKSSASTFDFKLLTRRPELPDSPNRMRSENILSLNCETKDLKTDLQNVKALLNDSPFGFATDKGNELSLLFNFTFKDSETSRFGSFDPKIFDKLRASVEKELLPLVPGARVYWMGPGDYQWYLLEGLKFAKYVNLSMLIFMILGLRVFMGTWKSGIIYCTKLMIAVIWLFGMKGLFGSTYDVLSSGLVLILSISSLEDFSFTSFDQFRSKSWKKSTLKFVVPGFYTSLTTMFGFLSLFSSEVETIKRMGIWAAWGALVEWGIVFLVLPSFYQQFPKLKTIVDPKKAFKQGIFNHSIFNPLPKKIAVLSLLVYPLAFFFFDRLSFNESLHHIFPRDHEYSQSIDYLRKTKEWSGNVSLLIDQKLDPAEINTLVSEVVKAGKDNIVKFESTSVIQKWLQEQGDLTHDESISYFKASRFSNQFIDDNDKQRIVLYLKDISSDTVDQFKKTIKTICSSRCHVGGEIVAYSEFASVVPKTLIDSLTSSLLLVSLVICFIAVAVNRTNLIPSLLLSSYWSPFFVIMMLGCLHSNLDFWKAIFASILIGMAGDNAIQYLFGAQNNTIENAIEDRGGASIITGVLMGLIALLYLGSYFSSPRSFGIILSIGIFASLLGELWLFKSYMEFKLPWKKHE